MNKYLISDLTTSKVYAVIFANTAQGAKAYYTRKGSNYIRFMGCTQVN